MIKKTTISTVLGLMMSLTVCSQNSNKQLQDQALPWVSYSQNSNIDFPPNSNKGFMAEDYCDDFNVPNTTIVEDWTEIGSDWQIIDNKLRSPGGVSNQITLNGSAQSDGIITIRGVYEAPIETKYIGIMARYTNPSSKILFKIQDNTTSGNWNSYFVYTPGGNINGSGDFGMDAVFQLEYVGADITIRIDSDRDGVWDHTNTTTTSLVSDGVCGIEAYGTASADAFCLGEYNPVIPPSVPLSNWAIILGFFALSTTLVFRFFKP